MIANTFDRPTHNPEPISCNASDSFQAWLAQNKGSIALSTYQAGKIALVGWNGTQISLLLRQFAKPMGIAVAGNRLVLATRDRVLYFANAELLAYEYLETELGRYDALYLPRAAYFTGDLNIHDLAFGDEDLWVVNTRFSCLSCLSQDFSFIPRWKPPFISAIVPEDRAHLNGLVMENGKPKYVTALGATDSVGGWRENKARGGILMEVESGEIILNNLSMPHSPCLHGGYLWLLNSGLGELLRFDPRSGRVEIVCALPGFLRGLTCVGNYALVGMCQMRERHIFSDLPIETRFPKLICGVAIVDLQAGKLVGVLEFTTGCQELYDIEFLPNILRPNILNDDRPEIKAAFTAPEFSYWLRPSKEIKD
jgi:uncharacterized protein (TIGR03032 family)